MNIHPNVLMAIGGIFVILIVASIVVFVLRRAKPQANFTELTHRIKSWWVMVIVFAIALSLHRMVSLLFFGLISFLAFREYLSLIPKRDADRRVFFWAFAAIPFQYFWIAYEWYGMYIIWIPVYVFLFLPLRMVLIGETKGFLRAAGTIHWGLMTTVFAVSHLAALLVLKTDPVPGAGDLGLSILNRGNPNGGGAGLVLYLVFLTQFNDVAQYLWGKALGRHKVTPTVSPNKTVEGLLGGVVTTTALAWFIAPLLTPLDLLQSLSVGVMISLAGFIGDIVMSALKRDLAVKDSGTMLPGHGGLLDRLDSLTYTAPLFYHYVVYTHY